MQEMLYKYNLTGREREHSTTISTNPFGLETFCNPVEKIKQGGN